MFFIIGNVCVFVYMKKYLNKCLSVSQITEALQNNMRFCKKQVSIQPSLPGPIMAQRYDEGSCKLAVGLLFFYSANARSIVTGSELTHNENSGIYEESMNFSYCQSVSFSHSDKICNILRPTTFSSFDSLLFLVLLILKIIK